MKCEWNMRPILLTCVLLVVALGCTQQTDQQPAPAPQEPTPQIKPIIKSISAAQAQVDHCDAALNASERAAAQPVVARSVNMLSEALTARAQKYGLERETATQGISTFFERVFRVPQDLTPYRRRCGNDAGKGVKNLVAAVHSGRLQDLLDRYVTGPITYDVPVTIGSTNIQTYALPFTQARLVDTIVSRFEGCRSITITAIVLDRKVKSPPEGVPVFAKPPIKYHENWTAACGEVSKTFKVTHARDSEGPVGVYLVQ